MCSLSILGITAPCFSILILWLWNWTFLRNILLKFSIHYFVCVGCWAHVWVSMPAVRERPWGIFPFHPSPNSFRQGLKSAVFGHAGCPENSLNLFIFLSALGLQACKAIPGYYECAGRFELGSSCFHSKWSFIFPFEVNILTESF